MSAPAHAFIPPEQCIPPIAQEPCTSEPDPGYLNVVITGSGTVTGVNGSTQVINCPGTCDTSFPFPLGTGSKAITLTAAPASGYQFTGWGGSCSGTATTCSMTVFPGDFDEVDAAFQAVGSPDVTFNPPNRIGKNTTLSASASAPAGVVRVEYVLAGKVRGSSTTAPGFASKLDYTGVGEGPATLSATVYDGQGQHVSSSQANVQVDLHAGITFVTGPADGAATSADTVTYTFNYDPDTTSAQFLLDGVVVQETRVASLTVGLAKEGTHTITARVTDNVGNTTDYSRKVVLDRTPPTVTLTDPGGPLGPDRQNVNFSVADATAVTVACSVDGGDAHPCAAADHDTLSGLSNGDHDFTVAASDAAGNLTRQTERLSVDAVAPGLAQTYGPGEGQAIASHDIDVGFDKGDASRVTCSRDGEPERTCSDSQVDKLRGLPDGAHSLVIRAFDGVGNVATVTRHFTVDTVDPSVMITAGPAEGDTITSRNATITWDAESGVTVTCALDKAAFTPCTTPSRMSLKAMKDGVHTFHVRATDAAGNFTVRDRSFKVLVAPARINSPIRSYFTNGARIVIGRLIVEQVPAHGSVAVSCSGKSSGCPFKTKTFKPKKGTSTMTKAFAGRHLRSGTVVEIRITAPDSIGKIVRFTLRSYKSPKTQSRCLAPGSKKPKTHC